MIDFNFDEKSDDATERMKGRRIWNIDQTNLHVIYKYTGEDIHIMRQKR